MKNITNIDINPIESNLFIVISVLNFKKSVININLAHYIAENNEVSTLNNEYYDLYY